MIYKNIDELIGNTPLVELVNIEKEYGLKAKLFVKIEYANPSGSVKDRPALFMIKAAEEKGLKKGGTLIEPTSGNTGIALSMICAVKGYKLIIVMPETMSIERRKLIQAYGAEIVLTEGKLGMNGAVKKAEELQKEIEGSMVVGQFVNPANTLAHVKTTGPEIYNELNGEVAAFLAGFGTGGTVSGVGQFLKSKNKDTKIIAIEPESSPLITKNVAGPHKIQGIGANFIPEILDLKTIDEVVTVSNDEAMEMTRKLPKLEGLLSGISGGANVVAAIKEAKKLESGNVVTILPDSGLRYLSTDLY